MAFGITANASGSRGNADGDDTSYTNTHVNAGKQLVIASGGDTTLKGALVTASQVVGQVKGNLNMESLQDTSTYASKDQNIGGSITVGSGVAGSINAGQTKVNGDYRSVGQQTGIAAGDGGFQIDVKGNTDLKGAVIASTQNAIDQNKNNFSTGTLTQSELQNHSNYEASSWGIGLSAGKADEGKAQTAQSDAVQVASFTGGLSGTSAGFSSKDGSSESTTHSGISGNTNGTGIAITDDLKQQSLTGKTTAETVASISRDVTTGTDSGSLIKDWDAQKLKDNVTAGAQITAAFGQAAAERIGTYADDKVKELENTDPAEAARWKEGGQYRVALHTATGALTGGLAGAAGAFTSATAMPIIGEAIEQMGLPKEVAQGLNQVAAGALGAVVGGAAGAASGMNVEANNRQLHQSEYDMAKKNAKLVAEKLGISEQEAEGRIVAEILSNSDKQTAEASGGKHDYEVRSIIGCQNLNCDGYKNDPQYANNDYNKELSAPNQGAYDAGQGQLGTGKTYDELVTGNIKQDPFGSTIAGVGIIGLGAATGGLPALGYAGIGGTLGLGVNGTAQLISGNSFDWYSFGMAGVTGAVSTSMGFIPAVLVNTGGALAGSGMAGSNPNYAMGGAAVGTAIGYPIGSVVQGSLNNVLNPWYRQDWKDVGMGMSAWNPRSPIPSWFGGTLSSGAQEVTDNATQNAVRNKK